MLKKNDITIVSNIVCKDTTIVNNARIFFNIKKDSPNPPFWTTKSFEESIVIAGNSAVFEASKGLNNYFELNYEVKSIKKTDTSLMMLYYLSLICHNASILTSKNSEFPFAVSFDFHNENNRISFDMNIIQLRGALYNAGVPIVKIKTSVNGTKEQVFDM